MIDLPPIWRLANPTDIHQMAGAGKQRDHLAVLVAGRHDGQVMQMASSHPRIIGDVAIAFAHRVHGEFADEMHDRAGHGIDVAGCASDGLGQHFAFQIEHTGGYIPGLAG